MENTQGLTAAVIAQPAVAKPPTLEKQPVQLVQFRGIGRMRRQISDLGFNMRGHRGDGMIVSIRRDLQLPTSS